MQNSSSLAIDVDMAYLSSPLSDGALVRAKPLLDASQRLDHHARERSVPALLFIALQLLTSFAIPQSRVVACRGGVGLVAQVGTAPSDKKGGKLTTS